MNRIVVLGAGWLGSRIAGYFGVEPVTHAQLDVLTGDPKPFVEGALVVINATGKTGRPNIDSLKGDPMTFMVNAAAPVRMALSCDRESTFIQLGSGCIYNGDGPFSEDSPPNFWGSTYSASAVLRDQAMQSLAQRRGIASVVNLRLRLPVDDIHHERNTLCKIAKYAATSGVVHAKNSITYVPDLLKFLGVMVQSCEDGVSFRGTVNAVAPGPVSPAEVAEELGLRPHRLTIEELDALCIEPRSHCILTSDRFTQLLPSALKGPEACYKAWESMNKGGIERPGAA